MGDDGAPPGALWRPTCTKEQEVGAVLEGVSMYACMMWGGNQGTWAQVIYSEPRELAGTQGGGKNGGSGRCAPP